jgi:hypothetical protein
LELKATGLFTAKFLEDYNNVALLLNKGLQDKTFAWAVGELPPFSQGVSPWCNCQDVPENYLDKIYLTRMSIKGDTASLDWSWEEGMYYSVVAARENGAWKLQYLEGFDFHDYQMAGDVKVDAK